jgi:CrcB protein
VSWLAVGLGAAIGAWLRWGLGLWLNSLHSQLPLGTLAANLGGAYLIGIAVGLFAAHPSLSPEWRLFLITGFLGGLTTFSAFSAEAMLLLQRGDYGWALWHSALHLIGSVGFCIAGFASYRAVAG